MRSATKHILLLQFAATPLYVLAFFPRAHVPELSLKRTTSATCSDGGMSMGTLLSVTGPALSLQMSSDNDSHDIPKGTKDFSGETVQMDHDDLFSLISPSPFHVAANHVVNIRGKIVSAIPLLRAMRFVWNRALSWLRKERRDEGEDSGLTTHEFVDASHSTWAVRFCSLYVLVYLSLSVVSYSFLFEKWSIIDSLYFAVTTFTSVGYGDLVPSSKGAKAFTVLFAIYGISILGIALGIIGRNIVDAESRALALARDQGVKRIMHVFTPHEQRNETERLTSENTTTAVADNATIEDNDRYISDAAIPHPYGIYPHYPEPSLLSNAKDLLLSQSPNLAFVLGLAILMGRREGWSLAESLYYCFITVTTVGLGDFTPSSQSMRLFAVFFIPLSVAVLGELLGRVAAYFVDRAAHKAERQFMSREMTLTDLEIMDTDNDGDVSEVEFMSFMLVAMQKVDRKFIIELRELFQKLDAQGNGVLQKKDLEILAERKRKRLKTIGSLVRRGSFV